MSIKRFFAILLVLFSDVRSAVVSLIVGAVFIMLVSFWYDSSTPSWATRAWRSTKPTPGNSPGNPKEFLWDDVTLRIPLLQDDDIPQWLSSFFVVELVGQPDGELYLLFDHNEARSEIQPDQALSALKNPIVLSGVVYCGETWQPTRECRVVFEARNFMKIVFVDKFQKIDREFWFRDSKENTAQDSSGLTPHDRQSLESGLSHQSYTDKASKKHGTIHSKADAATTVLQMHKRIVGKELLNESKERTSDTESTYCTTPLAKIPP